MNHHEPFRGIFTIPATPFGDDEAVKWDEFRRVLDFCVECGAHGIVWPVNASGFAVLTDEERLNGMEIVVEQVDGRIPVVLGVQGVSTPHARVFSRRAKEVGGDAVIAMTPYVQELEDEDAVLRYFDAINQAFARPIFIQNHTRGSVLSVPTMVRLINEIEHVAYVKEETFPVTHKITQLREQAGPKLKGVFGGAGGRFLLQEYPRGVAGQMPGCHITDVMVRLWDAFEEGGRTGDFSEAKRIYGLVAPLYALETLRGTNYTEVLRRRGVVSGARSRLSATSPTIDAYDHAALDDALRDLEPLFTWSGGPLHYGPPESFESAADASSMQNASSASVDTFDRVG